jgi:tRNA(Ile)-lysidine synthase
MAGPPPAIAAVRLAVRQALQDLPARSHVLVAGSGGADSTALAAATAFVAPKLGLTAGFACADQRWSADSGRQARSATDCAAALGLSPVVLLDAPAPRSEGAARDARREALLGAASSQSADAILLGHTLDDQAETVLLRLARGSGARSLSAMAARDGVWRRPLLGLRRELVRTSCAEAGLTTWDDPSNVDPAFARARVRDQVLPLLEATLGPGIAESLARSAGLLRADADALDSLATDYLEGCPHPTGELAVDGLVHLLPAVRSRVLRSAALRAGCPATALSAGHVAALDSLVTAWKGQGPLNLPGGIDADRLDGRIILKHSRSPSTSSTPPSEARQMRR